MEVSFSSHESSSNAGRLTASQFSAANRLIKLDKVGATLMSIDEMLEGWACQHRISPHRDEFCLLVFQMSV